jgi:hypothetical protein
MTPRKTTILSAAIVLLDAAVLVHLGGSLAACLFAAFLAFFLLPAVVIAARAPFLRTMPADLRVVCAAVIVVLLAVPWYFVRKALGWTMVFDSASSVALTFAAVRFGSPRVFFDELRPAFRRLVVPVLVVLPAIFALVWLGFEVRAGDEVRYYGLFAIDLGNLSSTVSALKASPMLPLSDVSGSGTLAYHWLYFVLPAMLADFLGARIPAANALILMNLVMAALLVHTVTAIAQWFNPKSSPRSAVWAALLVLFAPFTVYFYQTAASRFPMTWFAMPTRNHLLLSPLNSVISFGNNTFAIVLALVTIVSLERWNREGRISDALFGVIALSVMTGYSITLVFSIGGTLLVWMLLGRVRKPLLALTLAVLAGGAAGALFLAIGLLTTGGSRHIAVGFDNGQFMRMVFFGMTPLWGVLVLGGVRRSSLSIFHVLIAVCIAVPTLLYNSGSETSATDFSMKTASLLAVAFAPLLPAAIERLRAGCLPRWRSGAALLLTLLGIAQSCAFILQFPWYRATRPATHAASVPADYHDGLVWLRDHSPPQSIVVDPEGIKERDVLYAMMIGERRVWLPTFYTDKVLIAASHAGDRREIWRAFAAGDRGAARTIASEADYLIMRGSTSSSDWRLVRPGTWNVFESTIRNPHG